jgi:hypothetical protein
MGYNVFVAMEKQQQIEREEKQNNAKNLHKIEKYDEVIII